MELVCPIEDDYYIFWLPAGGDLLDYDDENPTNATFAATLSADKRYETHEITCDNEEQYFHAMIIVTGNKCVVAFHSACWLS